MLGRHEVDRAQALAGVGQLRVGRVHGPRQPEVAQIGVAARQQDVAGLDVAVHQPGGVRGIERFGDLTHDLRRALGRQGAVAPQELLEVCARDIAHRDVEMAVFLARRVDGDHVRVIDRRGHARLALEAIAEGRVVGTLVGDDLDRDRPVQAQVGRRIDDAHPAAADDVLQPPASQLRARCELRHSGQYGPSPLPGDAVSPLPGGRSAKCLQKPKSCARRSPRAAS